jgi:RNA-binding protein NOB1
MDDVKPVHSIVLDASPLLINEPSISTLLAHAEKLCTVPQVVSEIKDNNARTRLEITILPFLTIRNPSPASVIAVTDFARRTGDLTVLSKSDVQLLALAYELECELNHGDWRLRKVPGQKRLNGPPPKGHVIGASEPSPADVTRDQESSSRDSSQPVQAILSELTIDESPEDVLDDEEPSTAEGKLYIDTPSSTLLDFHLKPDAGIIDERVQSTDSTLTKEGIDLVESDQSDSDGWITPSNIKKQRLKDQNASPSQKVETSSMQVATITTDFAMQNVLLQMNLNLLSPSMLRVRQLKSYILRCHACFEKSKDMSKQFCPRCGKPTLTRVACSTNANGEFKIHLKKNMQWNTRGDRFSIPKPVAGTSNGKVANLKGGGKGGWGHQLILAEDQKEYVQALTGQSRRKEKDLMDDDYLPCILTGDRNRPGGRPKVGGGRNVNSKKR